MTALSIFYLSVLIIGNCAEGTLRGYEYHKSLNLPRKPTKLIIDHDGAFDDATAIFIALLNEKYFNGPKVIAITTGHGYFAEPQVYLNTQRILNVAGRRDIPIYRGSQTSFVKDVPSFLNSIEIEEIGDFKPIPAQREHAVLAFMELSKKYEGDLAIATIGSLTNIALAVSLDSIFMSRLTQLYVAAGFIYGADHPNPEFNAFMDSEAYYKVVHHSSPDKALVLPFSIGLSMEWRKNVLGKIPTQIMRAQNAYERIALNNASVWSYADQSLVAMMLDDSIVTETKYSNNSIILCGPQKGINTNDFTDKSKANINLYYSADSEAYKNFLYKIFTAELHDNKP